MLGSVKDIVGEDLVDHMKRPHKMRLPSLHITLEQSSPAVDLRHSDRPGATSAVPAPNTEASCDWLIQHCRSVR